MSKLQAALKRAFIGRPMSSGEMEHTLLPKSIALPVFSSDALSSNAYATQEAMIVLALAGTGALTNIVPISLAVATLLAIVIISYRETVRAYPSGGGAYRVSKENLGMYPGLIAASALLIDYALTVAVSMTAGVDAIVSAATSLDPYRVQIALFFVILVGLANLRGAKESGILFAIPTYGFILSVFALLITGFVRCAVDCPSAESAGTAVHPESMLTFFLILKAFAAGTTALTGVEAIADGVGAFRYPQSKNAAQTLAIMGALSISMFLGISYLANATDVVYVEGAERTVVAQIAHAIFSGGPAFYILQIMSALILLLAANTAYQDFPRISSILAGDHFMPRQFSSRGDRLVFSNGIIILSLAAGFLIVAFNAELTRLIQLYLVGVFISFTFSQTGMVLHSRRLKPKRWQRTVVISGIGAVVTGVVLIVVVVTKFSHGAWMVIAGIPILVFLMRGIHKHYEDVKQQLAQPERRPVERRAGHQNLVILVTELNAATGRAIGYSHHVQPRSITAITPHEALVAHWRETAPDIDIAVLGGRGTLAKKIKSHLGEVRHGIEHDDFLTVVIPEVFRSRSVLEIVRNLGRQRLKASLLRERGTQVLNIPLVEEDIDPTLDPAMEPARNIAVVLVSGVHNATLQAIEYAETLRPTQLHAVSLGIEEEETSSLGDSWLGERIPHPLEIEAAPFRDLGGALKAYLAKFDCDGRERIVTVVIPEFVVPSRRHQVLHGQTALIVKRHLLFQKGVVVASVPYYLD
ncbi:MAG: amino acid permease [Actinobacteria bacterium]|nr:amino acid permease [Actinomycetota bacterium]